MVVFFLSFFAYAKFYLYYVHDLKAFMFSFFSFPDQTELAKKEKALRGRTKPIQVFYDFHHLGTSLLALSGTETIWQQLAIITIRKATFIIWYKN